MQSPSSPQETAFPESRMKIYHHILGHQGFLTTATSRIPFTFVWPDEMLSEFSHLGAEKAYEVVVTQSQPNRHDMCETLRPVPTTCSPPPLRTLWRIWKHLVYENAPALWRHPPELITKRVETNWEISSAVTTTSFTCPPKSWCRTPWSTLPGWLRGFRLLPLWPIWPGLRRSTFPPHYRCPNPACKFTTFDIPSGYGGAAHLPDARCPKCGTPLEKTASTFPLRPFWASEAIRCRDIDLNFSGEYQRKPTPTAWKCSANPMCFRAGTIGTVAENRASAT